MIVAFPMVCLMIISIWRTAVNLLEWLTNFEIVIPLKFLLLDEISINAMEVLRGWQPIEYLQTVAGQNWLRITLYIILITFLAGVWTALVGFFSGLAFNALAWLTGGLQISVSGEMEYVELGSRQSPPPFLTLPNNNKSTRTPQKRIETLSSTSSGPRLEIISPIQRISPITNAGTFIGSSPDCEIMLDNLKPRHAQISYEEGRYILRDFSQGETMVQGFVVNGVNMIKDGFLIQLGHYRMIFKIGA